jgi:sushi domain-containing protein 2
MAWIAICIILAVIVPLLMCIVCGVYCYRKKQLKEDPSWRMPIPHSRTGSRAGSRRNLNSDGSEFDDDTIKKVRRYDATYRTNEPLAGKPNIEFEPKKFGLEDEDVTSSEGGEYRDRVARDIEYKSVDEDGQPRQTGRRALGNNGYKPVAANDDLPPPLDSPTEAYSPAAYSPTFSGLNRDSQMSPPPGGVQVFPNSNTPSTSFFPGPNRNVASPSRFFDSPASPTQEVGLPPPNNRSTEV